MDELDHALTEAWCRLSDKVKRDRQVAAGRWRRTNKAVLNKPVREWCLVIRASDTRFEHTARSIGDAWRMSKRRAHLLWISGELIRKVTKPVEIPPPGVRLETAAKLFGRTYESLRNWDRAGVLRHHVRPRTNAESWEFMANPPVVRGRKHGRGHRRRGKGVLRVFTDGPLDPNNVLGRPPHLVWGTLWRWHWKKMRRDHDVLVRREPCVVRSRWRPGGEFRGWNFVCPGRVRPDGTHERCGRRCEYLYYPLRVWTMARYWDSGRESPGFELPPAGRSKKHARWKKEMEAQREKGNWRPGMNDLVTSRKERPACFACKKCWGVRCAITSDPKGWNVFVSVISGGLLRGSDVPILKNWYPMKRRKKPYRRRSKQEMEAARRKKAA